MNCAEITARSAEVLLHYYDNDVGMFLDYVEKYGENRKAGEKFLEENKKKAGVLTTESGLQYKVLTQGTGKVPNPVQNKSAPGSIIPAVKQYGGQDGL